MSELYTHPSLRNLTHEQLAFRLDAIRNRRLVAAIEYKSVADARNERLNAKLSNQWDNLADRIARKLSSIEDDLKKIDADIRKLTDLNHKVDLTEFKL